jgi:hypothetical protein
MANKDTKAQVDKKNQATHAGAVTANKEVDVLYQKMGDRWFAFSLINDEVFVGSIEQSEIDALEVEAPRRSGKKLSGNS